MSTIMNTKASKYEKKIVSLMQHMSFKEICKELKVSMYLVKRVARANNLIDDNIISIKSYVDIVYDLKSVQKAYQITKFAKNIEVYPVYYGGDMLNVLRFAFTERKEANKFIRKIKTSKNLKGKIERIIISEKIN